MQIQFVAPLLLASFLCSSVSFAQSNTPASTEGTSDADDAETEAAAPPAPPSDAPEVDPYAEAKTHFETGVKLYDAGNFDAALSEFSQAYDQMAGHPGRPIMMRNMGRAQEALFLYDAAIASYEKYLEIAPEAKDADEVRKNVELLKRFLGTVELKLTTKGTAPEHYQVWAGGREVGKDLAEFRLTPGTHAIEVKAAGYSDGKVQITVISGKVVSAEIELQELAKEYKGLPPVYFWSATGAAAGAAVAGGVLGVLALSKSKSAKNKIAEGPPASLSVNEDDQKKIDRLALSADICFGVAGVFAAGAVVLGVLTDWDKKEEKPKQEEASLHFDAAPLPSGGWLSVQGSF